MSPARAEKKPTRLRAVLSLVLVIVLVICVWKIIDYRTQPPPVPPATAEATSGR